MGVTGDRLGSVRGVSRNCSVSVLVIVWECPGSVLAVSGERLGCVPGGVRCVSGKTDESVRSVWGPSLPKDVNSASFLGQRLLVGGGPAISKGKKERLIKTFFFVTKLGHRQSSCVSREMNPRFAEAHFFQHANHH